MGAEEGLGGEMFDVYHLFQAQTTGQELKCLVTVGTDHAQIKHMGDFQRIKCGCL